MEDTKVCTFKNSTLYESHLQLLKPGNWLNDEIIQFYYEYIQKGDLLIVFLFFRYLEDECAKLSKTVALVHPSSVEMCKFMSGMLLVSIFHLIIYLNCNLIGAELKECLESLNLSDADFVFIPVNDNEDASSVGGTHW